MKIFALSIAFCFLLQADATHQTGQHLDRETTNQKHSQGSYAGSSLHQVHEPTFYNQIPLFHDLIYARPHMKLKDESNDHARAFAIRPEIKAIDLKDPKIQNIGVALQSLREGIRDHTWFARFHLTVDRWLKENNVDKKKIQAIKGFMKIRTRRQIDFERSLRDKSDAEKMEKKRVQFNEQRRVYRQQPPRPTLAMMMEEITAGNQNLSVLELIEIADKLRGNLQKKGGFSLALTHYLRNKGFSTEEIDLAIGSRLVDRTKAWNNRSYEKRKKKTSGNLMLNLSPTEKDNTSQRTMEEGRSKYQDPDQQLVLPSSSSRESGISDGIDFNDAISGRKQGTIPSGSNLGNRQLLPPKKRKATFPPSIGNRIPIPKDTFKENVNKNDGSGCQNWWDAPGCFDY